MSTPAADVIERVVYVTFFGIGFRDAVLPGVVSDGLEVRVFPQTASGFGSGIDTTSNRSGIFFLPRVPGLRMYELPAADQDFWESLPSPLPSVALLATVRDRFARFTPFALRLTVPSLRRGPLLPPCAASLDPLPSPLSPPSPPAAEPAYVPLFSTPARGIPAGTGVVRATLLRADTGEPAAWAVLEVSESGRLLGRGIANEHGEVAVHVAYPEPRPAPTTSPPGGSPPAPGATALSLTQQQWPLEIAVRHNPLLRTYVPDARQAALADLCDVLAQPSATLMTTSPPAPLTDATLRYGRELVLGEGAGARADLFISPA